MSESKGPIASVLLPVYNAETYLEAAIESVLGQTFRNFELLLLDDGSTDDSKAILDRFASKDKRCLVHSWPNRGLIATLNAGVTLASGSILLRMDSDDICKPERFERQIDYLNRHPECVAVGSKVMLIDAEDSPIAEFAADALDHQAIDAAHMSGKGGTIVHPVAAIRKAALLKIGGYRGEFTHAEDLDLFLRLAEIGQLANLDEVLLDYRQHIASIGYRYSGVQWASAYRAVYEAHQRRGLSVPEWASSSPTANTGPTVTEVHRKWAWWALRAGNLKTARKHAIKAFSAAPFNLQNIKVLACALRGG